MADRFFAEAGLDGQTVELSGTEAHHLAHVLRRRVGDEVELFDGRGGVARAVVSQLGRRSVELELVERWTVPRESSPPVTLASALPKGDRVRWLVEKATELGVDRFVPLICQRSVVVPSEGKQNKLRQTVVEACKQCGRNWLMEIAQPVPWTSFVQQTAGRQSLLVADPVGRPVDRGLLEQLAQERRAVCVAVGPEGGFTERELADARAAGAELLSLGPRTLRVETAGLTVVAWLVLSLGWGSR